MQRFVEPGGGGGGVTIEQGACSMQERAHEIMQVTAAAYPADHFAAVGDSLRHPPARGSSQDHQRDHLQRSLRLLLGQGGGGVAEHGERIRR